MTEREVPLSSNDHSLLRLWKSPSWPSGPAPSESAWAVEWRGAQIGHPTSYALLGVHVGADTATDTLAGERFTESRAGQGDVIRFGLAGEYRSAVEAGLVDGALAPAIAAEGMAGSSFVAFHAVARFLAIAAPGNWNADDDSVRAMWAEAFQDASVAAMLAQLSADDVGRRKAGLKQVRDLDGTGLSRYCVRALLETAQATHAELDMYPRTPNDTLIRVLWTNVPALDPRWVLDHFDSFDPAVRPSVLRALAHQPSAEAAMALNDLALREAAEPSMTPPHWPVLLPLAQSEQDPALLLDGLLALLPLAGRTHTAGATLLAWAKGTRLDGIDQARVAETAAAVAKQCMDSAVDRLDKTPLRELYDDDTYGTTRSDAGLLLDLLGYLDAGDAQLEVLRTAASHPDPWIALWAVRPLTGTPN